jgi:hypothetical protein
MTLKGTLKLTQKNSIGNVPFRNDFLFANKSMVALKKRDRGKCAWC